jgi:hypothetical protein
MTRPGGRAPRNDGGVQWFRALVLIAALVVVGVFILARTTGSSTGSKASTSHPTTAPTSPATTVPSPTTTAPPLPASQVKVQVLNGLRTGALAGQWTAKLKTQYGYQTAPPDDATATVTTSVIYVITPGYEAEAQQLAARVGLPSTAVNPTVPAPATVPITPAERAATNLVLIVGNDLAGQA